MVIACIDFSNQGHRLHLMRSVIKAIIHAGHHAICITDNTAEIKTWMEAYCPEGSQRVIYHNHKCIEHSQFKWNSKLNDILIALHYWKQYNSVLKNMEKEKSLKIDVVIINYIDVFLSCLMPVFLQKLIFKFNWAGLYIHPRYMRTIKDSGVQTKKSGIRDIDYLFKSENCVGVGIFDNGIVKPLEFRLDRKVTLIPDIADVSMITAAYPLADEIKMAADSRTVIGSIGMSYYTGTVDLIKLALACKDHDFFFVFCGNFDEESYKYIPDEEDRELLRKFRKSPAANCIWKEGYLENESEYNAVFNALDILFMMYPEHYTSSNRLTKAAYFNKFVLAADKHCVGENVIKYHLGEVAAPGNTEQQMEKLAVIRQMIKENKTPVAQRKEYYSLNNEAMFQIRLKEMLGAGL